MAPKRSILRSPRRGIALVIVVCVMAIAAVMAYAMLAGAGQQEQVAVNTVAQANADALAESGVDLAMYYLTHTSTSPATPPYTQNGITFGSANGSVNLTVGSGTQISTGTNSIGFTYPVTSVATSGGITHTATATILLNTTYQAPQAISSNAALTVGTGVTVSGSPKAIVCSSTVATSGTGAITGNVYDTGGIASVSGGSVTQSASVPTPAPTFAQIRSYATYTYNGQSCTADTLAAAISAAPTASASNPAHIFISAGNVNVTGTVTISGTLIVNGNLALAGAGTVNLTVTPVAADAQGHSFPAVLVSNQFQPLLTNKKATLKGLCLFQNGVAGSGGSGTGDSITINGGLLLPTSFLAATYKGTAAITYVSANASVPDLTTSITAPLSVRLFAWSD